VYDVVVKEVYVRYEFLIMAALWYRAGHYILPCGFFYLLSFFFPRIISAVADCMYTHTLWCSLSANLRCRSETCCMWTPSHNFARCLAVSWAGRLYLYRFSGALAPKGILPYAKFTLRPSLALSSVTALHSSNGRHLYSAGRPSHWALAHIL